MTAIHRPLYQASCRPQRVLIKSSNIGYITVLIRLRILSFKLTKQNEDGAIRGDCLSHEKFCKCAWLITLLVPASAGAQMVVGNGKSIDAFQVDEPPIIDGRLDDDAWAFGTLIEDFHEVVPQEFGPPSEKSLIYVVYTRDALYLGARFYDSEPDKVSAQVLQQGDFSWGEDSFTVIVDPFNNGRSGYAFDLTPNSTRNQAIFANVTNENWQWDGIWHGASVRDDEGWVAEIEIPFKTLSFNPNNQTWGLNFIRYIGRKAEQIGWVSANRRQNPANSGKLTGIRNIDQGMGLDVVPGLKATKAKHHMLGESSNNTEPSVDLFYKVTPAITAALTVNTDFSGTGADERQINLTRFALFFPERRGFFLQDTDIFEFGRITSGDFSSRSTISRAELQSGRPFFSRRIGLSELGGAVDIDIGGKLTGRPGRWDFGMLAIRQDASSGINASDLFVARIAANVLDESSVGLILTHGDPNSNLDNSLAGVDFRYTNTRFGNGRTLEGSLWYQQSETEARNGDDAAYGYALRMPSAEGFRGAVAYKELQENFFPALGFVNRAGVRDMTLEGGYTWYTDWPQIRSIHSGIDFQKIEKISGELQSQVVNLRALEVKGDTGDAFGVIYYLVTENLESGFEISDGIVIPAGNYEFEQYCLNLESAEYRKISVKTDYCGGEFFDGDQVATGAQLLWRPNPHFKIATSYQYNEIKLPYGEFITRLMSLRADIAFSNKWSWENLVQYDNVSYGLGLNSILRYVPKAGREIVFVVNQEYVDRLRNRSFTKIYSDMTFKISYTFRF